ncbi:MAG TPA: hypothetical protein DDZ96_05605 [Porphyromonadaceae bacterium]|jgi:AraC-like DNA-binding protein/mannose-6-phosphate isomerase-like protein (cupin superfamily)|nr:hypothetical protein [Porphyromonadaceae bacterium]HBK30774.1 hypothetical protein [Porphyromonadaceae bacterium]HBL33281.1 hypothetical protein [Porphyromonadaceae bacterium]HCM21982.1 hypothetical protein [Porphyromonadaceae bacterium]
MKEYSFTEVLPDAMQERFFYIRHFTSMDDAELEWPHRHLFFSFVWFTHGSGIYVIDSDEFEIKPQRLFYVAPKQVHNWGLYNNNQGYFIAIDYRAATDINLRYTFPFLDIDNADADFHARLFANILTEFQKNDALSNDNVQAGIRYYLLLLQRIAEKKQIKTSQGNTLIEEFKQLVLSDYSKSFGIRSYADKLNVRTDQLNRTCETVLGISAKQYLLNLKITEAKRLLIYSGDNISEIAFQMGFDDSSYFARIFKKKTGLSPGIFLKKYRKLF